MSYVTPPVWSATLNLALQVAEASPRMVLCVNMMDEARSRGMEVDIELLEQLLGLPVVGIAARNRRALTASSSGWRRPRRRVLPHKPRRPFFYPIPKRWSRRKA